MKKIFILFTLFLALHPALYSQWSTNPAINNNICNLSGEQAIPKIATCSNGDTYIGYFSNEGGNYNVRLQRLDAQGNILWAPNGILISNHTQQTWLTDWDMTCDGANHAILTFNDIRTGNLNIVGYRISPTGAFVWGADGILLSNTAAFNAAPKVVSTAAGNIVVAWSADNNVIIQKINPAGTLQWGPAGITLTSTNRMSWPQLLPVGTDEVIMKYFDDSGPTNAPTRHVYAKRFNAAGTTVWASPVAVSTAGGISAWTQIFPFINDGSDGFYIAWHDDRDNNQRASVFVQHVSSTGTVLFQTNGVEVSSLGNMNHYYPKLALPPGSADVFVFWNEMNPNQDNWGLSGQKINAAGINQWGSGGMTFIPVSTTNVYPYEARNSPTDMVLFYEEYSGAINGIIKAMRISTSGTQLWSPAQKTLCTAMSQKVHPVVNTFGNNQWIVSWEDDRNGNSDTYAQNIQLNGDLGPYTATFGTISGTVSLVGGTGNVTSTVIQAGTVSTNPNAAGFYTMQVQTGTYTVTATLPGYTSGSQSNVVVQTNLTSTVNFTLNHIPSGTIEGTVTLLNGSGYVNLALVTAGTSTTHPDAAGHYSMTVAPGTYNVIATLAGYIPETVTGVVVADGQTVTGIDFSLTLAPTDGTITGTVVLNGGTGNVTQAIVNVGGITTNPDAAGFYTLTVPAGFVDVTASLTGYITQMAIGVQVVVGQTTPDVNFTLVPSANAGNIQGHVTITGGTADVTQAEVTASTYSTHPDMNGNYDLQIPAGAYVVTASHPYTTTQTNPGVVVTTGQTTTGIDFTLDVNRADMVCMAKDQDGLFLNAVDLTIDGPEGPYTGTILNDSLTFLRIPFGAYLGTGLYLGIFTVNSDTLINASNHHLVFMFELTGIQEKKGDFGLRIIPNPAGPESRICFNHKEGGEFSVIVTDVQGRKAGELRKFMEAGNQQILLSEIPGWKNPAPGLYLIRISDNKGLSATARFILR